MSLWKSTSEVSWDNVRYGGVTQWCVMCDRCGLVCYYCCVAANLSLIELPGHEQHSAHRCNSIYNEKWSWTVQVLLRFIDSLPPDSLESQERPVVWRVVVLILTMAKCTSCCEGKRWTPIKINWSRLQGATSWTFGSLVWQKYFTYHLHFNFPLAPITASNPVSKQTLSR